MASPPKLYPALLGGLFIGVVSALPYVKAGNSCCCLWLGVGGVLAAYVMQQNCPRPVSLGDGAAVGLLAGIIGFGIMLAISLPMSMLSGASTSDLSRNVLSSSEGMSPEVRELVRSIPPTVLAVLGGLFFLATGSVVSTVGGVLGAAFFRRSVPPPPPDDIERGPSPGGWTPPEPAPPLPLPPPPPPEPAPGGEPVAGERPTGDPPS